MIFDKLNEFMDAAAYNATPTVVDLGPEFDAGRGHPMKISVNCGGGDMAGLTAIEVHCDDSNPPTTVVQTVAAAPADVNGKVFSFYITPDQKFKGRYMDIALTGASAGTMITAGIVHDAQTNE